MYVYYTMHEQDQREKCPYCTLQRCKCAVFAQVCVLGQIYVAHLQLAIDCKNRLLTSSALPIHFHYRCRAQGMLHAIIPSLQR